MIIGCVIYCTGVEHQRNFDDEGRHDDLLNTVDVSAHRLYPANSSTDGRILFPVTFRTAAAYLVAKVRLYDTFNISFKVCVLNIVQCLLTCKNCLPHPLCS